MKFIPDILQGMRDNLLEFYIILCRIVGNMGTKGKKAREVRRKRTTPLKFYKTAQILENYYCREKLFHREIFHKWKKMMSRW